MFKSFIESILKSLFSVEENSGRQLGDVKNILVVRQHNQFGDMLASVSLFRALKEKYPGCKITLIAGPQNFYAITKNKFIDRYHIFRKGKLLFPKYYKEFKKILKENYDLAIVPATVSVSFTSNIIARLANAKIRIGPDSLNRKINSSNYLFDRRIKLDWKKNPDAHVADFGMDIVRPFEITTKDFSSCIDFDESDIAVADEFIESLNISGSDFLIGLHVGAGKPKNRWALDRFVEVIEELNNLYSAKFFLTGTKSDKTEIEYVCEKSNVNLSLFIDKEVPQLAAVISKADLFITNDTGVMHVAGATAVKQISIFGSTNPFNWAPVGKNKYFLRKSDLINDVNVEDVISLSKILLGKKARKNEPAN